MAPRIASRWVTHHRLSIVSVVVGDQSGHRAGRSNCRKLAVAILDERPLDGAPFGRTPASEDELTLLTLNLPTAITPTNNLSHEQDMPPFDPLPVIHSIWTRAGLPLSRLPELVLTGNAGPVLPSSFRVGELAQITTALSALAASYLHELRTDEKRIVTVDKREAALEFREFTSDE